MAIITNKTITHVTISRRLAKGLMERFDNFA
jgi:hypothetical protein